MPDYGTRTVNGKKVRHIVPLGTHCLAAGILRDAQLRRCALPFDWAFSTPGMIQHVLESDFADFIPPAGQEHAVYRDRFGLNDVFPHVDLTSNETRTTFNRRIARFRRILASRDATLFVMVSRASIPIGWHFGPLVDLLMAQSPNAELLAVQLLPSRRGGESVGMELVQRREGSRLYDFRPASDESALGYFPDVLDELMILRLIYQYHLDLQDAQ
ncbi:DUF1796 family putative cysteine peptidase [Komagataeibacter sp. FNDCR2]|uniref:DUF1796 family putative cysteine peptidase n=1 Tax=Komagataeibacter sp. FNDCR2 TaxID=2878682 RepID=UPI001E5EDF42|nr:DUF1796 family putative cysteine peptidase [Komagataeibacter sp. FNDCR2]MCE2575155.1 papain-like cysteine peptidase [Komagataeibacter sp. FNDCR2]